MKFGRLISLIATGTFLVSFPIVHLIIAFPSLIPYINLSFIGIGFALSLYLFKSLRQPDYPNTSTNEHMNIDVDENEKQTQLDQEKEYQEQLKQDQLNESLFDACHDSDFPKIRQAVAAGASLDARDSKNNTPLHIICLQVNERFLPNFINIISYLLTKGANPFTVNNERYSAFHLIVNKGLSEIFSLFKKAKNQKEQNISIFDAPWKTAYDRQITPLAMIIQNKDLSIESKKRCLEALLELGANVNLPTLISVTLDENRRTTYLTATPLIGLFYLLKNTIEDNFENNSDDEDELDYNNVENESEQETPEVVEAKKENALKILHAICLSFLEHGANPLVKTRIEKNVTFGSDRKQSILLTEENLPDHPLMNDLIVRANSALIQRNHTIFSIAEEVVLSQEEALLNKTINDAMEFQKALPESNAIQKLIDVFMQKKNIKAIECLVNLVTPKTAGYAHLCRELANQYLDSATQEFDEAIIADNIPNLEGTDRMRITRDITLLDDKPEKQIEVKEYRRLCLLYCLKGSFSREKAPAAQDIKKHLQWQLEKYMQDWERKAAIDGLPEKTKDDILDITSTKLVEVTCLSAALRKLTPQPIAVQAANSSHQEKIATSTVPTLKAR